MELSELNFTPHSDVGANEIDIVNQHKNLIDSGNYSDATTLLNNENFEKGVRASLLNSIQNKIRKLQLYLLNEYFSEKDTYYSDEEPSLEFMKENGYKFWSKPW